ncbi:zinc metalloprotease [Pedobacter immunditicola]|uniref:zinc metalloprotease n=1 Tax=Pedobacter immunditicola TaxID=3133440 RepID=UPI0030B62BF0
MAEQIKIRHCATMEVFNRQAEIFPEYRRAQASIETDINLLLEKSKSFRLNKPAVIQVVVHVIYNSEAENISDEQILSQIEVLNKDFRARNKDKNKVPEVWQDLVADAFIEFNLAKNDPENKKANGITRTETAITSFGTDNAVKDSAQGGKSPWPTDSYLNIWVCSLGESILGYAQFPGGPPETDGVVVDYRAFGTVGTATAPFNSGRTATHEIGHYLNLSHIFGDGRANSCSDSDYVEDTPNQLGPNYQSPTFPSISCDNGPHGDMFMNYMDYVDDNAMFMFTDGQAARMNATMHGPRASLFNAQG